MYSNLSPILFVAAAALITSTQAVWDPTRPWVFSEGPGSAAEKQELDLAKDLPIHNRDSKPWAPGQIPQYCYSEATGTRHDPAGFEVKNIYYTDCDMPWAMCKHVNASLSWETLITRVGQMPVGMRQYLSTVLVFPDNFDPPGGPAYTDGGAHSQSYIPPFVTLGVIAHEVNHLLDEYAFADLLAKEGYAPDTRYSQTKHWTDAYDKDIAVPTEYSRRDPGEDFADAGRYALSEMAREGGGALQSYAANWRDAEHQILEHINRFKPVIYPGSRKCINKAPNSPPVRMVDGQPF